MQLSPPRGARTPACRDGTPAVTAPMPASIPKRGVIRISRCQQRYGYRERGRYKRGDKRLRSLAPLCGVRSAARAAIAILILFTSEAGGWASVALSGHVTDATGGSLPSATVTVHKLSGDHLDESSQTDSQGRYSFAELPDGEYSVEAVLTGFVSVSYKPVRIYFPAGAWWNFVLTVAGFGHDAVYASSEVVGELLWRGARVSTANICLTRSDGPHQPICTVTNRLGQYFLDVPTAIYVVTVDKGGDLHTTERLDLTTAGQYRNKIAVEGAP